MTAFVESFRMIVLRAQIGFALTMFLLVAIVAIALYVERDIRQGETMTEHIVEITEPTRLTLEHLVNETGSSAEQIIDEALTMYEREIGTSETGKDGA